MKEKQLEIYLSDHAAMMTAERELIDRVRRENESIEDFAPLAQFLERLEAEVESEHEIVEQLLTHAASHTDPLKEMGAWFAEKVGRLKFNGQLSGYSELSRVVELEGLIALAGMRVCFWRALPEQLVLNSTKINDNLRELASRAEDQVEQLRTFHHQASGQAFSC